MDPSKLGYRLNVGIMVLNPLGLVWVGRRNDAPTDPEGPGTWWQMPQGGIDDGEDPAKAALRELREETGMRTVNPARRKPGLADLRPAAGADRQGVGRALPRPTAEMVCGALRGRRGRDRHRAGWRPSSRICRLALGQDGRPSRPHRAIQARGLRQGARRILSPCRRRRLRPLGHGAGACAIIQIDHPGVIKSWWNHHMLCHKRGISNS